MSILSRFIRDIPRRRKLKPVVGELPRILKDRYGRQNFYTPGQVKTAAQALSIKTGEMPYAFALACSEQDFKSALPDLGSGAYSEKRHELAQTFRMDIADLTCLALTRKSLRNTVGGGGFRPTDTAGGDF